MHIEQVYICVYCDQISLVVLGIAVVELQRKGCWYNWTLALLIGLKAEGQHLNFMGQ